MIRQPDNTIDGRRNIIYLGLFPPPPQNVLCKHKKEETMHCAYTASSGETQ